jgi:hypothetical protein
MADNRTNSHDSHTETNGNARYEVSDIKLKPLGAAALGLAIFTVVSLIISVPIYLIITNNTWNIFGFYIQSPNTVTVGPGSQPANAESMRTPPPPNPILQSNLTAAADMNVMRQDARYILETAAWVDKEKGVIRIPLERAIEISVQSGLPFTASAPGKASARPAAQPSPMAAPPIDQAGNEEVTPEE